MDPWEQVFHHEIEQAKLINDWPARMKLFWDIAARIGRANEDMIRECHIIRCVLDGLEVDSGVTSEIGFAAGIEKKCYGLRTDFRNCGDFGGIPINLQVIWWIERSGGRLFRGWKR